MSASLVGSEMCIRDRARTAAQHAPPGASGANCEVFSGASQFKLRKLEAPVSYTHLTLPTMCSV
eukprot:4066908-Alexandrium_andersonii.AAC.1